MVFDGLAYLTRYPFHQTSKNPFSGVSEFSNPEESFDALQILEDDCKPVFDMVLNGDFDFLQLDDLDENSAFGESLKHCLKSLLGDNPIGNLIRYEYDHMDKVRVKSAVLPNPHMLHEFSRLFHS